MRPKTRTERLDHETMSVIRRLCDDYALKLSGYYDRSELNAPGDGRISYMGFLAAMAGAAVSPAQESRIARSLSQVRQALKKAKTKPVARSVIDDMREAFAAYEENPDVFEAGELSTLARIARRARDRARKSA